MLDPIRQKQLKDWGFNAVRFVYFSLSPPIIYSLEKKTEAVEKAIEIA